MGSLTRARTAPFSRGQLSVPDVTCVAPRRRLTPKSRPPRCRHSRRCARETLLLNCDKTCLQKICGITGFDRLSDARRSRSLFFVPRVFLARLQQATSTQRSRERMELPGCCGNQEEVCRPGQTTDYMTIAQPIRRTTSVSMGKAKIARVSAARSLLRLVPFPWPGLLTNRHE